MPPANSRESGIALILDAQTERSGAFLFLRREELITFDILVFLTLDVYDASCFSGV